MTTVRLDTCVKRTEEKRHKMTRYHFVFRSWNRRVTILDVFCNTQGTSGNPSESLNIQITTDLQGKLAAALCACLLSPDIVNRSSSPLIGLQRIVNLCNNMLMLAEQTTTVISIFRICYCLRYHGFCLAVQRFFPIDFISDMRVRRHDPEDFRRNPSQIGIYHSET